MTTRVQQALNGNLDLDELTDGEMDCYFDLLPHQAPSAQVVEAYAELGNRSGAWGMDEGGNLVRPSAPG